ncbi:ArsR family transcriptional regulator [Haloglomus litoreum]|uniref:ArsR family transcriptional regulator n=1 Tax=Haloglomus litoreum TaxID=3034026 RepID=UPI0023E7FAA0|nr:ArsR family transcriptional regulator [Haloglomus sp. DT116]
MNSDPPERERWGEMPEALPDPYRRQLLVALLQHNPQEDDDPDPLNVVADPDEDRQLLQTAMTHKHLPKPEEIGFIEWDRDKNRIRIGPRWDDIAPLLRLIQDHQNELPAGWL